MNTNDVVVVIPTAGLGTRLKNLTANFNKSLLPYKGKPILSHIIESFPSNTKFIIPVGYQKDKVISFCETAYPEKMFIFVEIDDYQSKLSGPGYTLRQCDRYLNSPFWYIPCDSYYEEILPMHMQEDCHFIKTINSNSHKEYTTFKIEQNKIIDLQFKKNTDESYKVFTGISYIYDFKKYLSILKTKNSNEVIDGISIKSTVAELPSWEDMGNYTNYCNLLSASNNYDFSKTDEYTFFVNNKVVKYFSDEKIASKKYTKGSLYPHIVPSGLKINDHWLVYDFVPGKTLYEFKDVNILNQLLSWLNNSVWKKIDKDLSADANLFYKQKTYERLEKLRKKYDQLPIVISVDGKQVKNITHYLNNLDWLNLCDKAAAAFTHGDLHFENVIANDNSEFYMIDWRHEFGTSVEIGDIYYDLAKLYGGFILNYSKIKNGEFNVTCEGTDYKLSIPYINNYDHYVQILEKFIIEQGYDLYKVKTLIPIIYLNMAPLHTAPFDMFLYCLSLKLFEEIETGFVKND